LRDQYCPWPYGLHLRDKPAGPSKAYMVNGAGDCARNWVAAISNLTGRVDIDELTLLPFAEFVRSGGGAHLHERRMWCDQCLADDVVCGNLPYERLLWSMKPVVVCPLHGTYLRTTCPVCGRSQVTELARDCLPGHCAFCGNFLGEGERAGATEHELESEPSEYELWVARDFGNLLDMSSGQIACTSHENVRLMIQEGITKACHGRPRDFAENIRFARDTVINWMRGQRGLSLTVISSLSWIYGVPMRAWLTGEVTAWNKFCVRELPLEIHRDKDFRARAHWYDWDATDTRLRTRVNSSHPPRGVADAARLENMTVDTLRNRLPEVYQLIRDRALAVRKDSAKNHEFVLRQRIRECISQMVHEGLQPTRWGVANRLGRGLFPKGEKIYWEELPLIDKNWQDYAGDSKPARPPK
jgi:hypothetical protein